MPVFDPKDFMFFHPVTVRYSDLGPARHVNNARYLNYLEEARIAYRKHLKLPQEGVSVIILDTHITYHRPVFLEDEIKVGVRVSYLGNKSMAYQHCIVSREGEKLYTSAEVVMVAYDYDADASVPVPAAWRKAIEAFEG
jgi:acyl-CoA thioester hydrolase